MRLSRNGLNILKNAEGLRLVTYLDDGGVPTNGYGHTGQDVKLSDVGHQRITEARAEQLLAGDVRRSEIYVSTIAHSSINQNQYDALVIAAYNLGSFGATLKRSVQAGRWDQAAASLVRYIHVIPGTQRNPMCHGKCGNPKCPYRYSPGLVNRRNTEIKLFNTPANIEGK